MLVSHDFSQERGGGREGWRGVEREGWECGGREGALVEAVNSFEGADVSQP